MTAAPSVPNMQASGTLRFGFSTAAEFCAADSMPRNAHSVSEMLEPMPCAEAQPLRIPGRRERRRAEPEPADDARAARPA